MTCADVYKELDDLERDYSRAIFEWLNCDVSCNEDSPKNVGLRQICDEYTARKEELEGLLTQLNCGGTS